MLSQNGLEQAKNKHPTALCFAGCICAKLQLTEQGPCVGHKRFPKEFCRDQASILSQEETKEAKPT